jgi:hypothetical protein
VSDGWPHRIVWAASLALTVTGLAADVPRLTGSRFFGDSATYYAMGWSLAADADLQFLPQDLARVRREYPDGPQGVFLKRSAGGFVIDVASGFPWVRSLRWQDPDERRIYYAKPITYPVAAWPFVKAFGTRGFFLFNGLCLGLSLVLGYRVLTQRVHPWAALAFVVSLFVLSAAPAYLIWTTPEVFYLFLATAGLAAWSGGRRYLAAILFGIAIYSKLSNLWLALPLGLEPFRLWRHQGPLGVAKEMLRRGAVLALSLVSLFAVNRAITGEWYYQGGAERKTFYGTFPFEGRTTFGNSGIWMSANRLGARVAGEDDAAIDKGAEPPRSAAEYRQSFLWNLGYFWWGRFAGVIPYFPAAFVAALAFVLGRSRDTRGWLALAALVTSWLFYIDRIPDNWYGGSGAVGNRYFLNLLPLALYFVPVGRVRLAAAVSALVSAVFLVPLLAHPVRSAVSPGWWTMQGAWRRLPAELSMLNDLAIFAEPWRKKIPFGDTEGDRHRGWPADPKAYYLYFTDDGTFFKERAFERDGFWVRGGADAEIILRALEPVTSIRAVVTAGPKGDRVSVSASGQTAVADLRPNSKAELRLAPPSPFVYKDSFVYVLRVGSTEGGPTPDDQRILGSFVSVELDVARREPPASP